MCVPKNKGKRLATNAKIRKRRTTNNTSTNLANLGNAINGSLATTADKPKYGPMNKRRSTRIAAMKTKTDAENTKKNGKPATMLNKMIGIAEQRRKDVIDKDLERSLMGIGTRADNEDKSGPANRDDHEPLPVIVQRRRKRMPLVEEEYDYNYDNDKKKEGKKAKKSKNDENNNSQASRVKSVRIQSTQASSLLVEPTPQSSNQSTAPRAEVGSLKNRKRSRSKMAVKSSADRLLELAAQREKEKEATDAANLSRDERHKARSARLRMNEEKEMEARRENGGSDEDEERPMRKHGIRRNEIEDNEDPFAWRQRTYGKKYEGTANEHFAIRRY